MIIVVSHKINNPDSFWAGAEATLPELPVAGVQRIIQILPSPDMKLAVCIWEADSIPKLNAFLRIKIANWSTDTFQEVNMEKVIGLAI